MSEYDPTDIQRQDFDRESQDRERKSSKDTEESDFKWLMSSKRGRRIIWRFIEHSGALRSVFNTNAMQMAYAEGFRNHGLKYLAFVHTLCPELYPTMVKEALNERNPDDGSSRNDH